LGQIGLELSPGKSKLVLFTRRKINPFSCSIQTGDSLIHSSDKAKFLGITFDYQFLGKYHIPIVHSKAIKLLNVIKMLRGVWWGAHPCSLLSIYKMLIRASLEYGNFTFSGASPRYTNKLRQIQFQAIRLALGLRRSIPTNILLAEAAEWPIHICFSYLTKRYLLRAAANATHSIFPRLIQLDEAVRRHERHGFRFTFLLLQSYYNLRTFFYRISRHSIPPFCACPYEALLWKPDLRISPAENFTSDNLNANQVLILFTVT
jgi:hypothetical protein